MKLPMFVKSVLYLNFNLLINKVILKDLERKDNFLNILLLAELMNQ